MTHPQCMKPNCLDNPFEKSNCTAVLQPISVATASSEHCCALCVNVVCTSRKHSMQDTRHTTKVHSIGTYVHVMLENANVSKPPTPHGAFAYRHVTVRSLGLSEIVVLPFVQTSFSRLCMEHRKCGVRNYMRLFFWYFPPAVHVPDNSFVLFFLGVIMHSKLSADIACQTMRQHEVNGTTDYRLARVPESKPDDQPSLGMAGMRFGDCLCVYSGVRCKI